MQVSQVDRFIPQRKYTNLKVASHNISHSRVDDLSDVPFTNPKKTFVNTAKNANNIINYRKLISSALGVTHSEVLKCSIPNKKQKHNEICHSNNSWPVVARKKPLISPPDVVLDMPDINISFHNHVIDWGHQGQIASIFHGEVHLWTASKTKLACTQTEKSVLECVRWNRKGTHFAVSRNTIISKLSVIDAATLKFQLGLDTLYITRLLPDLMGIITALGEPAGALAVKSEVCRQHPNAINSVCRPATYRQSRGGLLFEHPLYRAELAIEWSKSELVVTGCSSGSLMCVPRGYAPTSTFFRIFKDIITDLKFSCNESFLLVSTIKGKTAIFRWPLFENSMAPAMIYTARYDNRCYIRSTSWHPWKESVLAVGETDNGITIWNVNNQKNMGHYMTKPYFKDTCVLDCLSFNPVSAELLVSFFYEDPDPNSDNMNFLTVFSDLHTRVDEVQFHIGRVPQALWDGTGTKLATVGADENLVIWNFFGKDSDTERRMLDQKKKKPTTDIFETSKRFNSLIR